MISVKNLVKEYGDLTALGGVTFDVAPGNICAYLGPNGAGKSTTVKILTGVMPPSAGSAQICGFDVQDDPIAVKRRIGYVPENAHLYPTLSVSEYFALVGTFHQIQPDDIAERGSRMLELFDIAKAQNQRISTLSKGMRQKVLITGALIHDPDVLLFDEPLSGLDANATQTVKEIVREMANRGKTVLYCSHMLDVVERLCDRVIILTAGKVVVDNPPGDVIRDAKTETLEQAFRKLTGGKDFDRKASEFADVVKK